MDKYFDTFNAKYLTFKEVAETFIYTDNFKKLTNNGNSLLMGPRGSGKTTLLKLLSPLGLHYWKGQNASEIKNEISFTSIYIPSDIHWKRQIEHLEEELEGYNNYRDDVSRAIVTANILHSVIDTFKALVQIYLDQDKSLLSREAKVCNYLVDSWKIVGPSGLSFSAIQMKLKQRIADIKRHIRKTLRSNCSESEIEYPEYFYDDYLDQIRLAIASFELEFKSSSSYLSEIDRWALCFDELEIAPKWLQAELIDSLRGKDSNIIFKLTTAPIVSLYNETQKTYYKISSQEDSDFSVIRIWNYSQEQNRKWGDFCTNLIAEKLKRTFSEKIRPHQIFSTDNLDKAIVQELKGEEKRLAEKFLRNRKKGDENYVKGSPVWFLFKNLAEIDRDFRNYLNSKGIDPKDPTPVNYDQESSVFRKVKPLAVFRYSLSGKRGSRSRKVVPLYYGLPQLYDLSDGNPRLLIRLVDELISVMRFDEYGGIKAIPINTQSRVVNAVSKRFYDHIDNHPEANQIILSKRINLSSIISDIGEYLKDRIIYQAFRPDQRNTFKVDGDLNHKYVELFQLALYRGIIVYVNPREAVSQDGLVGKEFRLNYMLYPKFNIPANKYESPYKLSAILGSKTSVNQTKMFRTNENP